MRAGDKGYTSPVLALHTWTKNTSFFKNEGDTSANFTRQGSLFTRAQAASVSLETQRREENRFGLDQSIQMIPVEDIISTAIESSVKKERIQETRKRVKTPPRKDLSCKDQMKQCCIKNFCCCCSCFSCCQEDRVAPVIEEIPKEHKAATRNILFTIKYLRHSYVDTPSNVRVLSDAKQSQFYENKLNEETLKFYYYSNEDFSEEHYNNQMQEAEGLARIITQIKGMSPKYPDPAQFQEMVKQHEIAVFGFQPNEDLSTGAGKAEKKQVATVTRKPVEDF